MDRVAPLPIEDRSAVALASRAAIEKMTVMKISLVKNQTVPEGAGYRVRVVCKQLSRILLDNHQPCGARAASGPRSGWRALSTTRPTGAERGGSVAVGGARHALRTAAKNRDATIP